jgi:hypothetical protein
MKTMILRVIKPSPLTWLFLALLVLAQVSFCTRTLFNEPSLSTTQYGIGNPVEIFYRDGSRQGVHVGWTALVLLTGTVLAQGPEPQHSDPYWQVSYWNNISLSGAPAREETVERIDYDWGYGSPHHTVAVEGFSARWERTVNVAEGRYRFSVTSDDGIRVYVDDQAIVNEWHDHPAQTYSADISLQAGHHLIAVEYYENTGLAVAKVSWEPIAETDTWRGQYYDNQWLNGAPVLTRKDARIAFHWGQGSPAPGIPSDNFGVRLWVDNHLLIDAWYDQASQSHSGRMFVTGEIPIVIEYYENSGVASVRLAWARIGDGPPQPAPGEVIVDDSCDL